MQINKIQKFESKEIEIPKIKRASQEVVDRVRRDLEKKGIFKYNREFGINTKPQEFWKRKKRFEQVMEKIRSENGGVKGTEIYMKMSDEEKENYFNLNCK